MNLIHKWINMYIVMYVYIAIPPIHIARPLVDPTSLLFSSFYYLDLCPLLIHFVISQFYLSILFDTGFRMGWSDKVSIWFCHLFILTDFKLRLYVFRLSANQHQHWTKIILLKNKDAFPQNVWMSLHGQFKAFSLQTSEQY